MAVQLHLKHPAPLEDLTNKQNLEKAKKARTIPPENPLPLPRYTTTNTLLGSGFFARVFRGYDRELRTLVALKQYSIKDKGDFDVEIFFLKYLHQMNVPHRLHFIDSLKEKDTITIVTEHLQHPDLSKLQDSKKLLPFVEIKSLTIQFLEFLHAIHAQGIIHGDLKPTNAIYNDGYLTVLDYGAMGFIENYNKLGSPRYANPSQILGAKRKPSDDLWSLGCILFELFTGKHLFSDSFLICNGKYNEKFHLSLIAQKIGLPTALYLQQCANAHLYYEINGISIELIDKTSGIDPNWISEILDSRPTVSKEEKIQFIDLLKGMLRYEYPLTPTELAQSPLFSSVSRVWLPSKPKDRHISLYRYCDYNPVQLPSPALRIHSLTHQCLHFRRDPHDRYVMVETKDDQRNHTQIFIHNGQTLSLEPTAEPQAIDENSPLLCDPIFSPNLPPSEIISEFQFEKHSENFLIN